ncbi:MAG: M23 family metallopeptidase [Clostridia bacterium]|nr:M23 family metallopeptidase [Clostridia bacterium]
MNGKRKLISFAVTVCAMLIGAAGFYGVKTRYEPKNQSGAQELPPTAYTTRAAQTAPPSEPFPEDRGQTAPAASEPAAETEAPEETSAAAQTTYRAETVNATMPRPEYFDIPLGMDISLDYSAVEPVFNATMGDWRTHGGIDFAGVTGDPVKACAAGFVTAVYDDPMYGTVMEIDHGGGITAKYCGLGKGSTVAVGTEVKMDDTVAYLGVVPCESESGAHLHFEMTENGKNVDPLTVITMP